MDDPYHSPPLSLEGWLEIEEEIKNGSPLTPARRTMFERVHARQSLRERWAEIEHGVHGAGGPIILGPEGSREAEEEIRNTSPCHPEAGAIFLDPTPPPDHADFLDLRSAGMASMRQKLAARRRT